MAGVDELDDLPPLRDVIAAHDLRAKKAFGQNFLLDLNVTYKIASLAGDLTGQVAVEVGPGPGGLTRALVASQADRVVALELDPRCVAALSGLVEAADGRLEVMAQDALQADITALTGGQRAAIVANLPYNVATPLLIQWLKLVYDQPEALSQMALMFQQEVAERIVAQPGSKAYGRLSIIAQWLCEARIVMNLPPEAFSPPPKVHSAIVRLVPRADVPAKPAFEALERVCAAAFQQRRKMVRQSLKAYAPHFEACGIMGTERAEDLTPQHYISLARMS